jgi:hypothetical protein
MLPLSFFENRPARSSNCMRRGSVPSASRSALNRRGRTDAVAFGDLAEMLAALDVGLRLVAAGQVLAEEFRRRIEGGEQVVVSPDSLRWRVSRGTSMPTRLASSSTASRNSRRS